MPESSKVVQLKEEGKYFFNQKQFEKAYEKYTDAIKEDPENAILYGNRAACSASLGRQKVVIEDAAKATQLDPTYAKAWSRLATAYQADGNWDECIKAWSSAISAIPTKDNSDADLKQKSLYGRNLASAREGKKKSIKMGHERGKQGDARFDGKPVVMHGAIGNMPWDRAYTLMDELVAKGSAGANSCVWVILHAYADLQEGNEKMEKLTQGGPNGVTTGWKGAVSCISNAVTCDRRVFHIADPRWIKKYNDQMKFEAMATGAWTTVGPSVVLREAKKKLQQGGWDMVRPALAITVRGWIMAALAADGITQDLTQALKLLEWAVELLEEGRRSWVNVPDANRGAIFMETFTRGVRAMYLEVYMKACAVEHRNCSLDRLYELADELYNDTMAAPSWRQKNIPDINGAGFHLAYNVYPAADALAKMAFFHARMAEKVRANDVAKASEHLAKAGPLYLKAADMLPPDDESTLYYYCFAIDVMYRVNAPLRMILFNLEKIRENYPRMKYIWEKSSLAMGGRDRQINAMLKYEEQILEAIKNGTVTENNTLPPTHPEGWPISLMHDDLRGTIYV